jgi:hypothetical protein
MREALDISAATVNANFLFLFLYHPVTLVHVYLTEQHAGRALLLAVYGTTRPNPPSLPNVLGAVFIEASAVVAALAEGAYPRAVVTHGLPREEPFLSSSTNHALQE